MNQKSLAQEVAQLRRQVAELQQQLADKNHRQSTSAARSAAFLKRLLELGERDRQLIAYEIHDGVVQDMTAALMFLEAARHELDQPSEAVLQHLDQTAKLLRGSIDEARRLISGLKPPVLEEEGVVAAIQNLAEEIQATSQLQIELEHQLPSQRLAPALEMAIYRIVQEGLNNVWRHSQSPRARVELTGSAQSVSITVRDWGIGFDPAQVKKKRYGLLGLRERARLLGGKAEIDSAPGQGTRIRVELPLADALLPSELERPSGSGSDAEGAGDA